MNEIIISKVDILKDLYQKQRFGIKPGLERTLQLCEEVGNPHTKFKAVHIAGTNGKGSVCSGLAAIFMSAGYKTGLYTSPHLIEFNERIRINENLIPDDKIIEYYLLLKAKSDQIGATFFEITTVMAFMYFAEMKVNIAVIETGMGGRYDSTNILEPILTIITKIDLDHQEYLGNTIEKIAYEKAGIIKENIPCVIGKNIQKVVKILTKSINDKSNIYLSDSVCSINSLPSKTITFSEWEIQSIFEYNLKIQYGLLGKYQLDNLKIIISAIGILQKSFNIKSTHIKLGLKNVKILTGIKARVDILSEKPLIILDGAHNSNSVDNLFNTIKLLFPEKKWNIIFNIMGDKEIKNIHSIFKKFASSLIIPKLKTERAMNSVELADRLISAGVVNVRTTNSVEEALDLIREMDNILIFGSFYLAGEVLEYFEKSKK